MSDKERKPPSPEELQRDLQEFLRGRFGDNVVSMPFGPGAGMGDETAAAAGDGGGEDREAKVEESLRFDRTPRQVKEHLDRFVIGQTKAKKALTVAVCDHYNHVNVARRKPDDSFEYVKQNVILLGPTGVGKTYLLRNIAHLLGVPFVKADITKFSETGYVGGDVDDLVRELVRIADGNVELAEYGIIFLDEIDKIATSGTMIGKDVSGRGVQTGLLKLLEETEVPARSPNDISAQFQEIFQMRSGGKAAPRTINTKHILFVVSGAFSGLAEIIRRRISQGNIGFTTGLAEEAEMDDEAMFESVSTQDFVEYGFEPEFIGRLPIRVALSGLSVDDLYTILATSEGSIVKQHVENFRQYGVDVAFTEGALREVARRAHEEGTGARGLMTVLESTLRDFKFELPGTAVRRLLVTEAVVEDPAEELQRRLEQPDHDDEPFARHEISQFSEAFEKRFDVRLELDENAAVMAMTLARELDLGIAEYLENVFSRHGEFLAQVQRKSGRESLQITPQALTHPLDGVDAWLSRQGAARDSSGDAPAGSGEAGTEG